MHIDPSLLRDFQQTGADLYRFGLVTSHGGNLSARTPDSVWITGTGRRLGYLTEDDLSLVDLDGRQFAGPAPSSDTALHLAIYRASDAGAVLHAHARHAVAVTADATVLIPEDFEGAYHLTDAPVVNQGAGLADRLTSALSERRVVILRDHGAYARADSLWDALHWVMALEESAEIIWLKRALRSAK